MSHTISHIHSHAKNAHHHTKKHLYGFRLKHNVGAMTIFLLGILAIQIHVLSSLNMLPIQQTGIGDSLSFAGSTMPIEIINLLGSFFNL